MYAYTRIFFSVLEFIIAYGLFIYGLSGVVNTSCSVIDQMLLFTVCCRRYYTLLI